MLPQRPLCEQEARPVALVVVAVVAAEAEAEEEAQAPVQVQVVALRTRRLAAAIVKTRRILTMPMRHWRQLPTISRLSMMAPMISVSAMTMRTARKGLMRVAGRPTLPVLVDTAVADTGTLVPMASQQAQAQVQAVAQALVAERLLQPLTIQVFSSPLSWLVAACDRRAQPLPPLEQEVWISPPGLVLEPWPALELDQALALALALV